MALVLLVGAGMVLTPATAANAASGGCSGNLIEHNEIRGSSSDKLFGYVDVYYNTRTGKNCARTISSGNTYGKRKLMEVIIRKCSTTTPGTGCFPAVDWDIDADYYKYYAGPVSVHSPNNCIQWSGTIKFNGEYGSYHSPENGVHC